MGTMMFRLIFGRDKMIAASTETQRQVVERALGEINDILAALDVKPKVSFDPANGAIELELPVQMPDEAKALPAPESDEDTKDAQAA